MKDISKFLFTVLVFLNLQSRLENVYADSPTRETLIKERNKLQLSMAILRVELLQNNKKLRELNEKILMLQKQLIKQLEAEPKMRTLSDKLEEIQRQLEQHEEQ